ncbi:MAG: dTMP kinase [Nanoarchaeota archaeon]
MYITFEGLEGVGKSFFLRKLKNNPKFEVILDDECDGEALKIINSLKNNDIFFRSNKPMIEFEAFSKVDSIIHQEKVAPSIKNNKIVLQDRGADTTCLYTAVQLKGDLITNFKKLWEKRKLLGNVPDKTILLTDSFESCIKRAEERNQKKYSTEEKLFLKKLDQGFKDIAKAFPERIKIIQINNNTLKNINQEVLLNL